MSTKINGLKTQLQPDVENVFNTS